MLLLLFGLPCLLLPPTTAPPPDRDTDDECQRLFSIDKTTLYITEPAATIAWPGRYWYSEGERERDHLWTVSSDQLVFDLLPMLGDVRI